MSADRVDALMKVAENDPALAEQLKHAGSLARLVQLGAERGFAFTEEELTGYLQSVPSGELSEQDLNAVVGGAGAPRQAHVAISLGDGRTIEPSPLKYELKNVYVTSYIP